MSIVKALIIGIIAGITDFLPVSASGHVTLIGNIMGLKGEIDLMFVIALHLGTLISVLLVFFEPISKALAECFGIFSDVLYNIRTAFSRSSRREKTYAKIVTGQYRKLVCLIIVALIPTIVFGVLSTMLSEALFGNLLATGIGLLVSALLLLVASFSGQLVKTPREAKYTDAVLIGAFQGFAGIPGVSRLAMTSSSAFLSGFRPKFTLMFSFILYIPTVIGCFIFEAIRTKSVFSGVGAGYTVIAMFTAAIVGYFVLTFLRGLIQPRFSRFFAVYCFAVGLVSIIIYLI